MHSPALGAALLRLALGVLFLAHALLKLAVFTLPGTVIWFEQHGLPGPLVYPVFAAELLGGLALLAGTCVRPVAVVLGLIALGAILPHAANGWEFANEGGGWEYPLFIAIVSFAQALLGPGAFAASRRPAMAAT
ncbi:DoxX family membrane protein [Dokdonella fugitiva]|uniref:Putative oxidoreductase n=1 Tax=Dokdonella fugitiva TaxID=328517 RepID=A0A4R2ICT9_9GAMM|nr:DoxX family membrane protein [Dokdonella fugitiva]TCO41956.1 putative oxidoreductase [Dokdonella fugitiva]